MPEGPEIRLAADEVARALVARPATRIEFAFPHLHQFSGRLRGRPGLSFLRLHHRGFERRRA
ncbi:MAG: hypothetical protein GY815_10190 [Gammaproteobacteria bacterium]|nr:hypothetical protein [Gammaproteobacteria bacterium]